jgi:hypothetical protein
MYKNKKKPINYKKERVVISDTLPYELPITFSNRHFYNFLVENQITLEDDKIRWKEADEEIGAIVKLLFSLKKEVNPTKDSIHLKNDFKTLPFNFKIAHKENDFRELVIVHPINQLNLVNFYDRYKDTILYYSNLSPFSIRRPVKAAKFYYFKDNTHLKNIADNEDLESIEVADKEYESLKTYFVYDEYTNIHKFFESYKYHRAEKKYNKLFKFDISKCFDSFYTHSVSWALLNKTIVKNNIEQSRSTFGGIFDSVMQDLNYGETNGIVIGPEFSRIFAELILQQIDFKVLHSLLKTGLRHKRDFEIYRYVDDFFVFYNDEVTKELILQEYRVQLKEYKLYLNESKTALYEKPLITEITIAKQKISVLLNKHLKSKLQEGNESEEEELNEIRYSIYVSSNKLITEFKALVKETDVSYKDILNYTLATIDRKVVKIINEYSKSPKDEEAQVKIVRALLEILDFTFFLYSVHPRVNTTIKLCMILSKIISFLKRKGINHDNKHLVFKRIFDDIILSLRKNKKQAHTQIETVYLFIVLRELGREYRLEEKVISDHFSINLNHEITKPLNYFCIITLLFYIGDKKRYDNLREAIKSYISKKYINVKNTGFKETELVLLLFDTISCPYLDAKFKLNLLQQCGIESRKLREGIISKRKYWFTKWSNFKFLKELEAKKGLEVY